jgi:MFS family permease
VLPAFLASLGAGPAQLGIIEGIAESVASFAKFFSGYLADKVAHRKPIVVGGYFVANAVKPLLALVSSWWQILGIRFFDRFSKGVRGTARDVMVAESVDKSALGSAYGLIQGMDSAGAIAGPLLALGIIGRFGMRAVFASAAIPGALCVMVAWVGIREVHRLVEKRASPPVPVAGGAAAAELRSAWTLRLPPRLCSGLRQNGQAREGARPHTSESQWLPKLPGGFYYVLAVVTLFSLGNSSDMFLVLRAGNIGIPASKAPLLGLVFNIMFTLLSWPAGKFSDRFSRSAIAAAGYFVFAMVYFVFARAFSTGDLADHGLLRTLLCADQSRAQGSGRRKRDRRCPGPRSWNLFFPHQRNHAALERNHRCALEDLRPSCPVLLFRRDRDGRGVRPARPPSPARPVKI